MHKYRKLASLLLALMLTISMIPASVFATEDETTVTAIYLYPSEFTVYDHVDGMQAQADNGTSYYYYSPSFKDGDELRVVYSDTSVTSYFFTSEQDVFLAFNGETIPLDDLIFVSDQGESNGSAKVTEWGVGKHSGSIEYMDQSCAVSVEVLENPVKSIDFKPSTFEIYQNSNGWWETKSFYYYDPRFREGDTLTVNFTDGTSGEYKYYKGDEAFVSEDGDAIMEKDVAFVSEQDELLSSGKPCWGLGDHKGHFEYMRHKSSEVTITIKASTVKSLKYTPASTFEAVEKSGNAGMWLKNSKKEEYFYYFMPTVHAGDKLELVSADGASTTYVGEEYMDEDDRQLVKFVNTADSSDVIKSDSIFFCEDQDETHWTVGNKNSYWVEYQGMKSDRITANIRAKGSVPSGRSVTRIFGQSRYETSLKIADAMKESTASKFDAVVLASGSNFPDALAGSFIATRYEGPIIIVNDDTLNNTASYLEKSLKPGGKIYILGGKSAVSSEVEKRFSSKFSTIRLGGASRYDTNMKILEAGMQGENLSKYTVFVCSGIGYADSLSASSSGQPILIVDPTIGLTDGQIKFLKSNGANDFIVAGGEAAVPKSVEMALKQLGTVDRIGGSTRYETSAMIASYFANDGAPNAVLAYGENFPDGLCAGPLAWVKDANLILCDDNNTQYAKEYMDEYSIVKGFVTGGPAIIADKAVKSIFKCNTISTF